MKLFFRRKRRNRSFEVTRRDGHGERIHPISSEIPLSTQLERSKSELNHNTERIHQTSNDVSPPEQLERPESGINPAYRAPQDWPDWLIAACGNPIEFWSFRRSDSYEMLCKIGKGTYSNVYKARDLITGKIVALKKVRLHSLERECIEFMIREILVLRKLDHKNVIKLEGLAASRASDKSLYLVLEYMEHDLERLPACQGIEFTEPQIKCYMKQLLSGIEYCHNQGVLHRDIKCGNLLIDNEGNLKITDFGLANFYDPDHQRPMTNNVVTIWYRPPELLLGTTHYGVGVDLWSAGCILGELLIGRPILPGLTEVEQLHQIYKLCGPPSEEYWKKYKFPKNTIIKPKQTYRRHIAETFKRFTPATIALIETLLSIDPDERGTATDALNSDFFTTEPYACEPSTLPKYPSTEAFNRWRIEVAKRVLNGESNAINGVKRVRACDQGGRAIPSTSSTVDQKATDILYSGSLRNPVDFGRTSNRWADDTMLGVHTSTYDAKNKGKAKVQIGK